MPDIRHSAEAPSRSPRKPSTVPSVHFAPQDSSLPSPARSPSIPSSPTGRGSQISTRANVVRHGKAPLLDLRRELRIQLGPVTASAGHDVFGTGLTKGLAEPEWERNDYARGVAQNFGGKTTATHGVLPTATAAAVLDVPEWEKETYVRGIAQNFSGRDTESHGILPGAVGKVLEAKRTGPDERGWGGFKGMDTFSNLPLPGPGGHLPPQAEPHVIVRYRAGQPAARSASPMRWPAGADVSPYATVPSLARGWSQTHGSRFLTWGPHQRPQTMIRDANRASKVKINAFMAHEAEAIEYTNPAGLPIAGAPTVHRSHAHNGFLMEPGRSNAPFPSYVGSARPTMCTVESVPIGAPIAFASTLKAESDSTATMQSSLLSRPKSYPSPELLRASSSSVTPSVYGRRDELGATVSGTRMAIAHSVTPDSMLLCSSHYLLKSAPSTRQQLCDALPAAGRASSRTNVQGHGGFSGVWLTAK